VPWAPDYVTLAGMRTYLRVPDGVSVDDPYLQQLITAASRAVDVAANRQFGSESGVRVYSSALAAQLIDGRGWLLPIDDVQNPASMAWAWGDPWEPAPGAGLVAGVDFRWWPENAVAGGKPYTALLLREPPTLDLTGTGEFGWLTFPPGAVTATQLQTARWWVRRESPYGTAGSPSDGTELRLLSRLDPDVQTSLFGLLRPRWPS